MRRSSWCSVLALAYLYLTVSHARAAEAVAPIQIDTGVRFVRTCYLTVVAFRTELDGYAIDACGTIFRTRDGGHGWVVDETTQAQIYDQAQRDDSDRFETGTIRFMHWWSPSHGLAGFAKGFAFVTTDGGVSWRKRPVRTDEYIRGVAVSGDSIWFCDSNGWITRADGRGRRWSRQTQTEPFDSNVGRCRGRVPGSRGSKRLEWHDPGCPGARGEEIVRCDGRSLVFERPGSLPRRSRIVTPGTGALRPLLAAERTGDVWYGYTREHMVLSEDGRSWSVQSDVPSAPRRVTYLPSGVVILEAEDGRLFRGPGGEAWVVSPAPALDRADVEQHRTGRTAEAPFACVARARSAKLEVAYSDRGCFHYVAAHRVFQLEVRNQQAQAHFWNSEQERDAKLGRDEVRVLVEALAGAVLPLERQGGCKSTSSREVTVSWECRDENPGTLSFDRFVCGDGAATSTQTWSGKDGYSRALAIELALSKASKSAGE